MSGYVGGREGAEFKTNTHAKTDDLGILNRRQQEFGCHDGSKGTCMGAAAGWIDFR